jgi:glycosyltransferase involved in cell wall biosynthesis
MDKNILFLMPNWRSPSEQWMFTMMESLGKNLKAICVWNSKGEGEWNGKPVINLTNFRTGITRLLSYIFGDWVKITSVKIIESVIDKYNVDTVIVNYGDFALRFIDIWKKRKVRVFVFFHGYDTQLDLRIDGKSKVRYFADSYKNNIHEMSKYATFVANSKYAKNLLVNDFGIRPEKIVVLYQSVNIPKVTIKKTYGILQITQLGRLVDCKSPDKTIEAFNIACDKGLNARLTLAGDGYIRNKCEVLKENSKYRKNIEIVGFVNHKEAEKLLERTDIYTQHNVTGKESHQTECLGVSILEAMSYGIPVVGTKSGGVKETVTNNVTGFLVEPGDIEAQAQALIKLAKDPKLRKIMGKSGRRRAVDYFSSRVQAKNLIDLINT